MGYAGDFRRRTGKPALTRGTRAGALLAAVVALAGSAPTALAQGNRVFAVGSNEYGQLGVGEDTWSPGASLIDGVTAVAGGYGHSLFVAPCPADLDGNVDLADYVIFEICLYFSGPAQEPPFQECLDVFDFDTDNDVDLADFALFQAAFPG